MEFNKRRSSGSQEEMKLSITYPQKEKSIFTFNPD